MSTDRFLDDFVVWNDSRPKLLTETKCDRNLCRSSWCEKDYKFTSCERVSKHVTSPEHHKKCKLNKIKRYSKRTCSVGNRPILHEVCEHNSRSGFVFILFWLIWWLCNCEIESSDTLLIHHLLEFELGVRNLSLRIQYSIRIVQLYIITLLLQSPEVTLNRLMSSFIYSTTPWGSNRFYVTRTITKC